MPPRPLRDVRPLSVRLAEVIQKLRSHEYTAELAGIALTDISKAADQENMELCVAFSDLIEMLYRRNSNVEMALRRLDDLHRTLIELESPERSPVADPTALPDDLPPPSPVRGVLDDVAIDKGTEKFFDLGRSEEADPGGSWVGPTRKPPVASPASESVPPPKKGSAQIHLAGAPADPPADPMPTIVLPLNPKVRLSHLNYLMAAFLFAIVCLGMKMFIDWPSAPAEPTIAPVTPVVIAEPPPLPTPEPLADVMTFETCDIAAETAPPITVTASVSKTVIVPPVAITPPSAAITEGTAFLILRDDQSRRGQWIFDGVAVTPDGHVLYHGAPMPETCLQVKAPGTYRASQACPKRELLYWFDN